MTLYNLFGLLAAVLTGLGYCILASVGGLAVGTLAAMALDILFPGPPAAFLAALMS